jgi:hypothetical protein
MYCGYAQHVLLMKFSSKDKVEPVKTEQTSYLRSSSNTRRPRDLQNCV